jgi:hypothetical protein
VPVEIAVNPSASPLTTTSGLVVPPGDYVVAFTPIGGTLMSFDGTLPTSSNGEIPGGTIPSAWINPATGLPFELTMGWVGSTGGATDIHEITDASVQTLSGKLPGLTTTLSADPVQTGQTSTYTLHVSTTSAGGPETQSIHVTDTFPSSVKPSSSGAGGTGWVCSVTGQTDMCTYTVAGALAAGTALPPVSMPVIVEAAAGTTIVDTASASSNDVFPVTARAAFVVGGSITVPPTGSGPLLPDPRLLIGAALLASGAGLCAAGLGTRRRALVAVKPSANSPATERRGRRVRSGRPSR